MDGNDIKCVVDQITPPKTREQYRARMAEQEWGLGPTVNFKGSLSVV